MGRGTEYVERPRRFEIVTDRCYLAGKEEKRPSDIPIFFRHFTRMVEANPITEDVTSVIDPKFELKTLINLLLEVTLYRIVKRGRVHCIK